MQQIRKSDKWMICKVQVSLGGDPATLIYDESHSFLHQCERRFGERLLGDDLKGYFKMCHRKDGTLYVHKRVKDRDW